MVVHTSSPLLPLTGGKCSCHCRLRHSARARATVDVIIVVVAVAVVLTSISSSFNGSVAVSAAAAASSSFRLVTSPSSLVAFNNNMVTMQNIMSRKKKYSQSYGTNSSSSSSSSFGNAVVGGADKSWHYLKQNQNRHRISISSSSSSSSLLKAYPDNNNNNNNNNASNQNNGNFDNDENYKSDYYYARANRSFRKNNDNPFGASRTIGNKESGYTDKKYNFEEDDDDDDNDASYRLARELAARRGINVLNTEIDGGRRSDNRQSSEQRQRQRQQQQPQQRGEEDRNTSPRYNTYNMGGSFGSKSIGSISSVGGMGSGFGRGRNGEGRSSSFSSSREDDSSNKSMSGDRYSSSSSYEVIVVKDDGESKSMNKFNSYRGEGGGGRGDDERQWRTSSSRKNTPSIRTASPPIPPAIPPTPPFPQWRRQQQIVKPTSPSLSSSSRLHPPISPSSTSSSSSFAATTSSTSSWMSGKRNYGDSGGSSSRGSSSKPSTNFNVYGRNAYRNAMPTMRPLSPPLSELASWGEVRGGRSSNVGGNSIDGSVGVPPKLGYAQPPTMGRYPWQGGYPQQPSPYNQQRERQRRRPPPPPYSVPLSLLAIQPHIEPLDRDINVGVGGGGGNYKSPMPFTGLDSSEFRRPYQQQEHQQRIVDEQRQSASYAGSGSVGASAHSQWQRQKQEQLQQELWRQQQQQQQQASTKSPTNSFKPLPFQSMPQADFRQPYPGNDVNDAFGGDDSARINHGRPPAYGFGAGGNEYDLPPGFASPNDDQLLTPPTTFGIDDPMMLSPFMVPPILFPPLSGEARQQQTPSRRQNAQQDKGVKVPKEPFLDRQKNTNNQSGQSPLPPSNSNSQDIRIPKDPFAERRKEQSRHQQPQSPQSLHSKDEGSITRHSGESEFASQLLNGQQQREKKPREPSIRGPASSPNGTDEVVKQPRDPFIERGRQKQQPRTAPGGMQNLKPQSNTAVNSSSSNNGDRGLGGVSFGSRSGEGMTYEEYSSYFDTP